MFLYKELDADRLIRFDTEEEEYLIVPRSSVPELLKVDEHELRQSLSPLAVRLAYGRPSPYSRAARSARTAKPAPIAQRKPKPAPPARVYPPPPVEAFEELFAARPMQIERAHKHPMVILVPQKPNTAPKPHLFMGTAVPKGHCIAAEDPARGVRVVMNARAERTTVFPPKAPEAAFKRIGRDIALALDHIGLDFEHWFHGQPYPLGKIVNDVKRDCPGTCEGEILAALHYMRRSGHLKPIPLKREDHGKLTATPGGIGVHPLADGKNLHTATLWLNGNAIHHWTVPGGATGASVATRIAEEQRPKTGATVSPRIAEKQREKDAATAKTIIRL